MSTVGFIGVGVMGMPMALNLMKGGHQVRAFDVSPIALEAMRDRGAETAVSAGEAAEGAEIVITMLPTGEHVADAIFGPQGVAGSLDRDGLLIDMSTGLPAHFDDTAQRLEALEAVGNVCAGGVGDCRGWGLSPTVGSCDGFYRQIEEVNVEDVAVVAR